MRQNAKAFFKQSGSVFSDRMAHPTVFIVDQSRLPKELVSQFHCGCDTGIAINDPFHPVESPKQIDRSWPAGGKILARLCGDRDRFRCRRSSTDRVLKSYDDSISGCDPNRGCAAHSQRHDGFMDAMQIIERYHLDGVRKQGLIEQFQLPQRISNPTYGNVGRS